MQLLTFESLSFFQELVCWLTKKVGINMFVSLSLNYFSNLHLVHLVQQEVLGLKVKVLIVL